MNPQPPTNQNLLLRFYGLRRSGNHPINSWLRGNLQGYTDLTDTNEWYSVHNDVYAPDYQRPKIHSPQDMRVEAPREGKSLLVVSYEDVPIAQIPTISITE